MAKELKDMTTYELLEKVWYAAIETTKAGGKQIGPSCTFFDVHFHIERRIDEEKNTADQLRACLAGDDLEDVPVLAKGLLRAKMSEMSEDHYAASWLDGTGKVLWGMLRGEHREWGMQTVSDETLQLLCTLARESGGWWQDDETFVRLDEWQATHGEMTHVPLVSRIDEAREANRVRESAKELPEGDYSVHVLAFDRRCQQWREADVGCIRDIEGRHPGKGYYTHWLPMPPRPEVPGAK